MDQLMSGESTNSEMSDTLPSDSAQSKYYYNEFTNEG